MVRARWAGCAVAVGVWLGASLPLTYAHVTVSPAESSPGLVQRYGLLVPTEKAIPTIRVEVQFPPALRVTEIESVPGWRSTTQRDRAGRVVGAVWEGGLVPPGHFFELGVLGRNPETSGELPWKLIQTYQDGSEIHWIGQPSAEYPAAVTLVRQPNPSIGGAAILAGATLIVALVATTIALLAWRRAARRDGRPDE